MTTRHGPAFWHFPRPALARSYVSQAEAGAQTLTLFAARGTGKTEFVKRDLIPAAEAAGYRAIYCDLWSHASNPIAAMTTELERALDGHKPDNGPPSLLARAKALASRNVKRVELGGEVDAAKLGAAGLGMVKLGGALEFEKPAAPSPSSDISRFNSLVAQLMSSSDKPVYLVLDEVQTLADARYEDSVKALRAAFQRHDDRIVRVFTGSSRAGLDRMFHRAKAALFQQGGSRTRFPALERGFIQHIAQRYREHTGGADFDEAAAWAGFEKLGRSARLFRDALNRVLTAESPDIAEACAEVLRRPDVDKEHLARWTALQPIDQAVLIFILDGGEKPFSAKTRRFLSDLLGQPDPVETWEIQNALERLEGQQLAYRDERGVYALEDEEFRVWLEQRQEDEPVPTLETPPPFPPTITGTD